MPKTASVKSLSNYPKILIKDYKFTLQCNPNSLDVRLGQYIPARWQVIKVSKTPCHYGGHRYWWLCPKCNKQVGVLYRNDSYVCRHCLGLSYKSQLRPLRNRLIKRIDYIRKRMGWQVGMIYGIGEKPKGMHQATFDNLMREYLTLEKQINMNVGRKLAFYNEKMDELIAYVKEKL